MTEMVDRETAVEGVGRQVAENLTTMMFRAGLTQRQLAAAAGVNQATLSRKLSGIGEWSLTEVVRLAGALDLELVELVGTLPTYDSWKELRACRDSNPKPSDP